MTLASEKYGLPSGRGSCEPAASPMVSSTKPTATSRKVMSSSRWMDGSEREQRAELVKFQVVLLHQEHSRRHRREAERAVGLQDGRRVQAAQRAGKFRLRPVRRIQRRHQRKHADGEQHRRGERARNLKRGSSE